jgi:signal transduction histidine kinase
MAVVFSSAEYIEGEVRRLASACGVTRFIPKPTDPQEVVSAVGQILGSKRRLQKPVRIEKFDREQLRVLNNKLVQKTDELEAVAVERQRLVAQLLQAHEEERERIAEALHDDPIQAVTAVGMRLEMLARKLDDPDQREAMTRLRDDVTVAIERLRGLVFELRPVSLEAQGLAVALETYLEHVAENDGLAFALKRGRWEEPNEPTRKLLFRMAQEALINVRKHAAASHVDVVLEREGDLCAVIVADDGSGFEPSEGLRVRPGHLGLPSMRDRLQMAGGSLWIESEAGAGSKLSIRLPELQDAAAV